MKQFKCLYFEQNIVIENLQNVLKYLIIFIQPAVGTPFCFSLTELEPMFGYAGCVRVSLKILKQVTLADDFTVEF